MAFSDIGEWTYLAPGQSAYWWYDRGGSDFGVQFAAAQLYGATGSRHNASDQGKARFAGGYVQYYVTITNVGATSGDWHKLMGGGLV